MDIFLKVLGILFLAVVLFIFLAIWAIKAKIRQFGKALQGLAASATPNTITLNIVQGRTWSDKDKVRELAQQLEGEGFTRGNIYSVKEIEGLFIWSLVHPGEGAYAVIYEHPQAGHWFDIFVKSPDETSLTFTTAPMGHELDQRPGHQKFFDKSGSPASFMSRLKSEFRNVPRLPVAAAAFKELFERSYAETMAWRNGRGGPTMDEIRRVAAEMDEEFSEDTIRQTHALMSSSALDVLDEKIRHNFLTQSNMSAAQWEEIRDRIFVVHDELDVESVCDDVQDITGEDAPEPADGEAPRKYMARLNDSLPPRKRFARVGTVTDPALADIYAEPAEDRAGAEY